MSITRLFRTRFQFDVIFFFFWHIWQHVALSRHIFSLSGVLFLMWFEYRLSHKMEELRSLGAYYIWEICIIYIIIHMIILHVKYVKKVHMVPEKASCL